MADSQATKPGTISDRGTGAATGGAVGLSAFASFIGLCCIGPWSVALLGVPGAVALARWQPYRPAILAVAAMMLAWGFWRTYRKQPDCADDVCRQRQSPWLKGMLWLAAGLLVLSFFADDVQWLLVDATPPGLKNL